MKLIHSLAVATLACTVAVHPAAAQTDTETTTAAATSESGLLTPEELHDLVGPVALYPDTLLIQVLVAATYPLDVIKADRLVQDNEGASDEELQAAVADQGWDDSVSVLAEAFPDVLADMAVHIEWTQTVGQAMLAQSDDVMTAVQDMRAVANENGALQSGDEQTVEVTQEGDEQTIIIQPADPEVVYVPQYEPEVVYVQDNSTSSGDILAAGLVTFGTAALINEIFNDNDYWHGYWGCRNCGGWGGGPIVTNPRNVNINGDVNIGTRPGAGWKPDDRRRDKARDDIRQKRDPKKGGKLDTRKPDRGDEMRQRLSRESGAADISRPGADRSKVKRPESGKLKDHSAAVDRTRAKAKTRPAAGGGNKAAARKPNVKKPSQARPAARRPSGGGGQAMHKRAPAQRSHAGGNRGRAASGGHRGGGRRR